MNEQRSWTEMTGKEQARVARWVVDTCLLFGATLGTAHKVAGGLAAALDATGATSGDAA